MKTTVIKVRGLKLPVEYDWGSTNIIRFYPQIGKGVVVMIDSVGGSLLRFEILQSIASAYGWPMD